MQGIVFSINLKQKLKKEKSLNIKYFLNKRLNKNNLSDLKELSDCDFVILEHVILEDKDYVIDYLTKENKKVIILVSNQNDKNKYNKIKNVLVINFLSEDYVNIIALFLKDKEVKVVNNFIDDLKKHKNIIIGVSLAHNVSSTKYLMELSNYLSETKSILYLEKDNSLFRDEESWDLNNKQIKYKKFSIIDDIEENISDKLIIIDYGIILDENKLKEIINYKNILVFTKKYKKTNKRYNSMLNIIKEKNKLIVFYEDINSKFLKKRKIKKHIKENIII